MITIEILTYSPDCLINKFASNDRYWVGYILFAIDKFCLYQIDKKHFESLFFYKPNFNKNIIK